MGRLLSVFAIVFVLFASAKQIEDHSLCNGFVPPEDAASYNRHLYSEGGIDRETFDLILDKVAEIYGPIIKNEFGANFEIHRYWESQNLNASANRSGNNWYIKMYGGLARHHLLTAGGFLAIACHEIGHHIGGSPNKGFFYRWASSEGQSDYFATMICVKEILKNWDYDFAYNIPETVKVLCAETYEDQNEQHLCEQAGAMGIELADVLANLNSHSGRNTEVSVDTPTTREVSSTSSSHPNPQCRLDTYFHGSLCPVDTGDVQYPSDPQSMGCWTGSGMDKGTRRRCWFQPTDFVL